MLSYSFVWNINNYNLIDFYVYANDISYTLFGKSMNAVFIFLNVLFLQGGSSGSAMANALKAVKDFGMKAGQTCVVVLPDSIRNYM